MTTHTHRWAIRGLGTLLAFLAFAARAAGDLAPLRTQFQLPDDKVDYATVKLTVDRLIDPATDTAAVRRQLDEWERAVRGNVPTSPSARQVLDALLKTLYEPGQWNQNRPFTYDLDDRSGATPGTGNWPSIWPRARATAFPCPSSFSSWANDWA